MAKLKKYIAKSGKKIMIDISDEACQKFGFNHGDHVLDTCGDKAIIIGVAPASARKDDNTLYIWAHDEGTELIHYYPNEHGLKKLNS